MVALPAAGGEPEVDDREPGKREEHQDRNRVGEEAGGGTAGEDGGIEHRGPSKEEVGEVHEERDLPGGVSAAMTWRMMNINRRSMTASQKRTTVKLEAP